MREVPWALKTWEEVSHMAEDIKRHVAGMDAGKQEDYIKYLTGHLCNYKIILPTPKIDH